MKRIRIRVRSYTPANIHATHFDGDGRIRVLEYSEWKTLTPIFAEVAHAHNERIGPRPTWTIASTELVPAA